MSAPKSTLSPADVSSVALTAWIRPSLMMYLGNRWVPSSTAVPSGFQTPP